MECENCNGSGGVECHQCGGKGRNELDGGEPFESHGQKPEYEGCNRCQASGVIFCPECGGSGDEDDPDREHIGEDEPRWQQEGFDNLEDWESNEF